MLNNIKNAAIDASFRTYSRPSFDIKALVNKYIRLMFDIHTPEHDYYRYLISSQQIFFLIAAIHATTAVAATLMGIQPLFYFSLLGLTLFSLSMLLNKRTYDIHAVWLAYIGINIFSLVGVISLGWSSGFYFYLLIIGPLLFLHPNGSLRLKSFMTALSVIHLLILSQLFNDGASFYQVSPALLAVANFANVMALYVILAYFTFIYSWAAKQSEKRLKELSSQWENLASKDMLTGLYNRRAMSEYLNEEVSRVNRGDKTFTLAMIDIDKFKSINDNYGHQAGDEVIRSISRLMSGHFRHHDMIARWGGEEFMIVFPETALKSAASIADGLRKKIAATKIVADGHDIIATVTIGLSSYKREYGLDACINDADQALYFGKEAGRNQVIVGQ
ncbi:MAG: GGDEF domain-containing protein [Gammaproteobacteria bacterium]|nr:GGDEF domain-containing protein [Gammaproteobacteria bacterium]